MSRVSKRCGLLYEVTKSDFDLTFITHLHPKDLASAIRDRNRSGDGGSRTWRMHWY
jgi:hypothetical protein